MTQLSEAFIERVSKVVKKHKNISHPSMKGKIEKDDHDAGNTIEYALFGNEPNCLHKADISYKDLPDESVDLKVNSKSTNVVRLTTKGAGLGGCLNSLEQMKHFGSDKLFKTKKGKKYKFSGWFQTLSANHWSRSKTYADRKMSFSTFDNYCISMGEQTKDNKLEIIEYDHETNSIIGTKHFVDLSAAFDGIREKFNGGILLLDSEHEVFDDKPVLYKVIDGTIYYNLNMNNFLKLLKEGNIVWEVRMGSEPWSENKAHQKFHNQGYVFSIKKNSISKLFSCERRIV